MSDIIFGIGGVVGLGGFRAPLNTLVVNSADQFPVQDGTTITLSADTRYYIGAPISTPKRFIVESNASISSIDLLSLMLTYTGTGTMFTSVGVGWTMTQLAYSCPSGTVFDVTGPFFFFMTSCQCLSCDTIGSFAGDGGLSAAVFSRGAFLNVTNQGITVSGQITRLTAGISTIITTSATCVALDLGTSTIGSLSLQDFNASGPLGSVALKGAVGSANIIPGRVANITNSALGNEGGMTALSGILNDDVGYSFASTFGVRGSQAIGFAYVTVSASTDIVDGTDVQVAGTFAQGAESSQATSSADGIITMLNRIEKRGIATVDLDIVKSTGSAGTYLIKIKKDPLGVGAPVDVDGAFATVILSGGGTADVTITAPIAYVATDKFFITIRGEGTDEDVTVTTQGFTVS